MTAKLVDKVALVTGASSGIGEATALALASVGAKVAFAARRGDLLEALSRRIQNNGGQALSIVTDIADEAQVEHLIWQTHAAWGRVDILINIVWAGSLFCGYQPMLTQLSSDNAT